MVKHQFLHLLSWGMMVHGLGPRPNPEHFMMQHCLHTPAWIINTALLPCGPPFFLLSSTSKSSVFSLVLGHPLMYRVASLFPVVSLLCKYSSFFTTTRRPFVILK